MSKNQKKFRHLFWYYLLVAYVLLQFSWWTFLMIKLNNETVLLKTEINLLRGETSEEIITKGNVLNQQLHYKWLMIAGEGIVFVGLLAFGIVQIQRSLRKEKTLSKQQKNFLLSVTHELKSPIASTKLQLQTLQKRELPRDKQLEILNTALNDTDRLNHLVENILMASRIENNILTTHKENCNVSEFCTTLLQQFVENKKTKHKVEYRIQPNIWLSVDKMLFPSIVFNLLENASKYSLADQKIIFDLHKENTNIIMRVSDFGIGIAEEEAARIFEKFYRIGNEETRKTKGTGLGLYITQQLSHLHNANITVKKNQPQGSIFEIRFES
jgi:two-component system, OmpR family, phosphate regulon sensor histidine kinase PhoR